MLRCSRTFGYATPPERRSESDVRRVAKPARRIVAGSRDMNAREWLGLESTHNPNRWCLPVVPGISTGGGFLFGGCGLGASIAALEGTTGRPVIWATAQYLAYARPPSVLDIDVVVPAVGRHTSQARAVGHVVDTEILTVNAALGTRAFEASGQWAVRPDVPPPGECPPRELMHPGGDSFADTDRPAMGASAIPSSGHCAVWTHLPDLLEMSAPTLAVLGDYVPLGLGQTLDVPITSNSLDNTIRVAKLVPTEWVLVDVHIDVVNNGFGHGFVYLWAEDGTLMATASQSAIIRRRSGRLGPEEGDHAALRDDHSLRPRALARPTGLDRRARRPRLHGCVVGRGGRRRRLHSVDAGVGVGAVAPARHGDRPGVHSWPGVHGPIGRLARAGRAGSIRVRYRHLVGRDRRTLERDRLRRALQASARHGAVPSHRAHRREGESRLRHLLGEGLPSGRGARAAGADPDRGLARGNAQTRRPRRRWCDHQLVVCR